MLFETAPDRFDGHTHQVELDESGDGLTSEGGALPHVHEVSGGVVQPARSPNYVSDHPGDLVPADGQMEPMMDPNAAQMDPNAMGAGMDPGMGAGGPPMGESALTPVVNAILEGVSSLEIAEAFLLG